MITKNPTSNFLYSTYSRQTFLVILNAALDCGSLRFARQAASSWLTVFPGDLGIKFILARIYYMLGMQKDALNSLKEMVKIDPECAEAWALMSKLIPEDSAEYSVVSSCKFALGNSTEENGHILSWAHVLKETKSLSAEGKISEAHQFLYPVMGLNLDYPLPAVFHLRLAIGNQEEDDVLNLARLYHERWPETLIFKLAAADAQVRLGYIDDAVETIHECVALDSAGQVVKRLWGEQHPYTLIWPENLEIEFDQAIPAEVAGLLGWNILPVGSVVGGEICSTDASSKAECGAEISADDGPVEDLSEITTGQPIEESPLQVENSGNEETEKSSDREEKVRIPAQREPKKFEGVMGSVNEAFEKLAKKYKQPSLAKSDGRYPVYVILSTVNGLKNQYGEQTRLVVDREMRLLADAVRKRQNWGAIVYYPDESATMVNLGMTPIENNDPWRIKLALIDLDKALAKKGAMIGAVLIIGNHEVVPFHSLPNPTDDLDQQVLSDNPYATLDNNYFVPEWPVGRLPGEKGPDAGFLLEQLRNLTRNHNQQQGIAVDWWVPFLSFFRTFFGKKPSIKRNSKGKIPYSLGYTAAVWQRSSVAAFRPIGDGAGVRVSPPENSSTVDVKAVVGSNLQYFNLHGLPDSAEWYGQRDVSDTSNGPDYPVALAAHQLVKNGTSPRIIFSEACYGSFVTDKTERDSIALRFLQIGAQGVIGSTCVAYGSVAAPLIGADLLGYLFWKNLMEGNTVGDSLMMGKIEFVREMNRRQGYLDGEDQKTLLSFILLGDPLVSGEKSNMNKSIPRMRNHLKVKTVKEHETVAISGMPLPVSMEILQEVKEAVEHYLPGIDTAKISIRKEVANNGSGGKNGTNGKSNNLNDQNGRMVVTLAQDVHIANHIHHHYARASVDQQGKLVKLAVSR